MEIKVNAFWSLVSSRALWVFFGVLGLAALVWFFGSLLAIGDFKPFSNVYIRFIVSVGILLIWFVRFLAKQIRRAKINANLVKEIQMAQKPMLKHISKDSEMNRQFAEIDRVLKNAKFSKSKLPFLGTLTTGQYLYQMPWYVVLGAAGSGKTTALKQSGLNFPLESSFGSSISGLSGTRDCDWFLTDNAVFLDTAGRLSLHDSGNEQDAYDWQEFLSLLKRYRPKQPINGVILTIGVDDLLNPKADFKQLSYELRKRIYEMSENLEINFPVYLMITKFDRLKGFFEFFQGLSDEQRNQSFGFDFSNIEKNTSDKSELIIGYVSKKLSEIQDNINASCLKILSKINNQDSKDAAFIFSSEFGYLSNNLLLLFRELYKTSKFENPISWRGIYFTSATQQGEMIDPVFENLGLDLLLNKKYTHTQNTNTLTKSFFLKDLFEYRIINDASLASENKKWSIKRLALYWMSISLITLLTGFFIISMINSYLNNSKYLEKVSEKTFKLHQTSQDIGTSDDFLSRIEFADDVKNLHLDKNVLKDNALSYRFGLYQPKAMSLVTESTYQRLLQDDVMPLVSKEIDEILRDSNIEQSFESYNALKAYLMIFNKQYYDSDFLNEWTGHILLRKYENYSKEQQDKIRDALNFILSQRNLVPNIVYDADLVDEKRAELANINMSDLIISAAFYESHQYAKKIPIISFETMGGQQTKLIFSRYSKKPITAGIHRFYTKEAYNQYVLPALIKYSLKFHQEDWVLGEYSSTKTNESDTLKNAHDAYLNLYVQAWKNYIEDIRLKEPKNLKEARDITRILSDQNNSPLSNIIKGISVNTSLNIMPESSDNTFVDKYMQDLIGKIGLGALVNTSDLKEKYLSLVNKSNIVDNSFDDFHALTKKQDGQPSTLFAVTESIKDLYEYLDVLNIAIEKGVDLPPNDSLFKYRAEINRLPSPFRDTLNKFSNFALEKNLNEQDLRNLRNEEKIMKEQLEEEEREKQAQLDAEQRAKQQADEQRMQEENSAKLNLESQLVLASTECKKSIQGLYPFAKQANNDISLSEFAQIFGEQSLYIKMQNLSPNIADTLKAESLTELVERDSYYHDKFSHIIKINDIHKTYFTKASNMPSFDFLIRIKHLDKTADSLIIEYNGKQYKYSHGPIIDFNLIWPTKNNDSETKLRIIKNNKDIGSISTRGDWSIFKLIEKSQNINLKHNLLSVEYHINGKKIILEILPKSLNNPFDLSIFRNFKCP